MNRKQLSRGKVRIPSLPSRMAHLLSILADDDIEFSDLSKELEKFTTIAARLISLANSAWASTAMPITTVEAACKHLGFRVVKNTSIALAVSSPFDVHKCPAFKPEQFWRDSISTAETVVLLSSKLVDDQVEASTANTGALLHSLGLLMLADTMPEDINQVLLDCQANPHLSINTHVKQLCGISYTEAAEALFSAWRMPEALVNIVAHQKEENYFGAQWQETQLLMLSRQVVHCASHNLDISEQPTSVENPILEIADLVEVTERMKPKLVKLEKLAGLLF